AGGRAGARSADLRSGVLLALCFLALALHRGLLVMLASASLGEDATLLDLLIEATQGAFERLVLTHSDFCQSRFTSPGQGSHVHASGSRPDGPDAPGRQSRPRLAEHSRGPPLGQTFVRRRFRPVSPRVDPFGPVISKNAPGDH